jgi:hypothetical protein
MKTVVTQLLDELLKEYPITMTNEILTNKQFWLDMEREQIINAYNAYYNQGCFSQGEYLKGEEYYNETYTSNAPIE